METKEYQGKEIPKKKYQVMTDLTTDEYEDLKEDIAARGFMVPVEIDEHGEILDGHHRVRICCELGIEDFPTMCREGLTEKEKITHAHKLNMARRHLTQEQKRELIKDQIKETPKRSDRQIVDDIGVSNSTVSLARKEMEKSGELCESHSSIGADGKERPHRHKKRERVNVRLLKRRV